MLSFGLANTGLADVVPLEWLQMFDWRELQMLISGASVPIDLEDLMDNTRYGGRIAIRFPVLTKKLVHCSIENGIDSRDGLI